MEFSKPSIYRHPSIYIDTPSIYRQAKKIQNGKQPKKIKMEDKQNNKLKLTQSGCGRVT